MNNRKRVALMTAIIVVAGFCLIWGYGLDQNKSSIGQQSNVGGSSLEIQTQANEVSTPVDSKNVQSEFLYPYESNKKWGYVNSSGQVVIKPQFDDAALFYEGRAVVRNWVNPLDAQYAVIDEKGAIVVPFGQYSYIHKYTNGLAAVFNNGYLGYIDKKGSLVIPTNFRSIGAGEFYHEFIGEKAIVELEVDGKRADWALIDDKGNVLVTYPYIWLSHDGTLLIYGAPMEKKGLMDLSGNKITDAIYDNIYGFSEDVAAVRVSGKSGFINKQGDVIIEPIYEWVGEFVEGLAPVTYGGHGGYINKLGQMVIAPQYDQVESYSEGLAAVRIGGKCGYIDKSGTMVIKPQFDVAWKFENGQAVVGLVDDLSKEPEHWTIRFGYIRPDGTYIFKPDAKYSSPYLADQESPY